MEDDNLFDQLAQELNSDFENDNEVSFQMYQPRDQDMTPQYINSHQPAPEQNNLIYINVAQLNNNKQLNSILKQNQNIANCDFKSDKTPDQQQFKNGHILNSSYDKNRQCYIYFVKWEASCNNNAVLPHFSWESEQRLLRIGDQKMQDQIRLLNFRRDVELIKANSNYQHHQTNQENQIFMMQKSRIPHQISSQMYTPQNVKIESEELIILESGNEQIKEEYQLNANDNNFNSEKCQKLKHNKKSQLPIERKLKQNFKRKNKYKQPKKQNSIIIIEDEQSQFQQQQQQQSDSFQMKEDFVPMDIRIELEDSQSIDQNQYKKQQQSDADLYDIVLTQHEMPKGKRLIAVWKAQMLDYDALVANTRKYFKLQSQLKFQQLTM